MDRRVFEAAESGDLDSILKGAIITDPQKLDQLVTRHKRDTVLHVAIRSGNRNFARQAIHLCPNLLSTTNSTGETPLHAAARTGDPEMAELLLLGGDGGVDLESRGEQGGAREMARARDGDRGDTPLHVAVRRGGSAVARLLVGVTGLDQLGLLNNAGESPLFLAIEGGFLDIARFFIRKSFSSPVCDGSNGMNALHAAVIRTHRARILEHHVPDLSLENLRSLVRSFVLHIEEYFGWFSYHKPETDIIELLLEREKSQKIALVEKQDKVMKWTPLHFAAHLGHVEATRAILEQNCSHAAYLEDKHGMTALHVAAREGHVSIMEEIIRRKPEACDAVDPRGWTVLHLAVVHERLNVVRYVLATPNLGFLLNAADSEGNTALHLALGRERRRIMNLLVDDVRVDKRATNFHYLKPIDVLRANAHIGELIRSWFMKKLERQGGQESLQSIVQRVEHSNRMIFQRDDDKSTAVDLDETKPSPVKTATKSRRLKKISSSHLLVATLIATVTFTAAFTIPGGYGNEGGAVLSNRPFFGVFVVADSVAFFCASASVLLHFFNSVEHNYHLLLRFTRLAATFTYVSVFGMVVAFTSGLRVVIPGSSKLSEYMLAMGLLSAFLYFIGFL